MPPRSQPFPLSLAQPSLLLPLGSASARARARECAVGGGEVWGGTLVLAAAAAKISHQQTARESAKPWMGMNAVKVLSEGEEGRRAQGSLGMKRLGSWREELEEVRVVKRVREVFTKSEAKRS